MDVLWKSFGTIAAWHNSRNAAFSRLEARGHSIYTVDLHLNSVFKFRGDQRGQYITILLARPSPTSFEWLLALTTLKLLPCPPLRLLRPWKKPWESRSDHPTLALYLIFLMFSSFSPVGFTPGTSLRLVPQSDTPFGWPTWILTSASRGPICLTPVPLWLHTRQPAANVGFWDLLSEAGGFSTRAKTRFHSVNAWVRLPGVFCRALQLHGVQEQRC